MTDKVDANNDSPIETEQAAPFAVHDSSQREAFMRDMYAMVAFFVANPHIPLPHAVTMHSYADKYEQVRQIADERSANEYGSKYPAGTPQTDFEIPGTKIRSIVVLTGPRP